MKQVLIVLAVLAVILGGCGSSTTTERTGASPTKRVAAQVATTAPTAASTPTPKPTHTATPTAETHSFTITSPSDGATVHQDSVVVSGTGTPGDKITQDISFAADQYATVDKQGKWSITARNLTDGDNELKFRAGDDPNAPEQTLHVTYTPLPTSTPTDTRTPKPTHKPALKPTHTPTAVPTNTPTPKPRVAARPKVSGVLTVEVLDIGQGDSILIRQGQTDVLIDGGPRDSDVIEQLRSRGIEQLDLVVATHPDADHIGGLVEVLNTLDVSKVAYNGDEHPTQTFEDFLDAVDSSGAKYLEPKRGHTVSAGNLVFHVLNPPETPIDDNNDSLVLRLVYGQRSFLFTGDVEAEGEESMLSSGLTLRSDVLKVAHHGSDSSSTPAFVQAVNPQVAVYSAGLCNDYGHPTAETLETLRSSGANVYGTDVEGTVKITTDGESLDVSTQRRGTPAPEGVSCKQESGTAPGNTPKPKPTNTPRPEPTDTPTSQQNGSAETSSGAVKITDIENSGREEWAVIRNTGSGTVTLGGWQLDAGDSGQTYTLPSYELAPGESVRITSGSESGGIHVTDKNIWNNDGDSGSLYNPSGRLVSKYSY